MITERNHVPDQADHDERPAYQSVDVPGTRDRIVLVHPDLGGNQPFPNLVRRTLGGRILWTAPLLPLPGDNLPDRYIDVRWEGQDLFATSFYGSRVKVDPGTGQIITQELTK
jgi:hypothetical protein